MEINGFRSQPFPATLTTLLALLVCFWSIWIWVLPYKNNLVIYFPDRWSVCSSSAVIQLTANYPRIVKPVFFLFPSVPYYGSSDFTETQLILVFEQEYSNVTLHLKSIMKSTIVMLALVHTQLSQNTQRKFSLCLLLGCKHNMDIHDCRSPSKSSALVWALIYN